MHVEVGKPVPAAGNEAKSASTAKGRNGTANGTAAPEVTPVTTDEVEKARKQFRDAIERAVSLGSARELDSDLATRFGLIQEARNRVSLERLVYEDLRHRFEAQERRAAADEMRRLALTNTALAERQAWYAKSNFVLAVLVGVAVLAQVAVVALLALRRH